MSRLASCNETSSWSRSICHGLYHVISRHSTVLLPTNLSLSRSVAICVMWLCFYVTFLVMYLYSRYALVLTRLHLGHALYVTFSISDLSSLCWSPTHKILSLSRPIQRHGPLRITSLLCHALVITWRHYTLASLSFLSLTMFLFAVTLIKSHDVTVILPHSISLCHSPTNNVTSPFADTWPKLIFTYCQVVVRIIVLYFIALM